MNGFEYLTDPSYWFGNLIAVAVFAAALGVIVWWNVRQMRRTAARTIAEMREQFHNFPPIPPDATGPLPEPLPPLDLGDDADADDFTDDESDPAAPPPADRPAAR